MMDEKGRGSDMLAGASGWGVTPTGGRGFKETLRKKKRRSVPHGRAKTGGFGQKSVRKKRSGKGGVQVKKANKRVSTLA